jgi:RNA polymerase sigma-70 factor (ECF subfamily)
VVGGNIQAAARKARWKAAILAGGDFFGICVNTVNRPNVDSSEVRLVERAAAGDREARRELFEQHRSVAYGVALRMSGQPQDAMDIVQDAFIRAFEGLSRFQGGSSFRTWLLRIVANRALDLLRSRRVRMAASIDAREDDEAPQAVLADRDGPAPGERLERTEVAERVQQAIDSLPPEHKSVFAMYASGEMTYGDIAEALGIPIGTVMSRLYHARRRLHALLEDLAPRGPGAQDS